jgi:hypothetical protein
MEKEFVPYEESLKLKELGFNESCFAMYQKNKKIWFCGKNNWVTNFEIEPDDNTLKLHIEKYPHNVSLIDGKYFLQSCANFTTPLYQQAFNFFREKYRLIFQIQYIIQGSYTVQIHYDTPEYMEKIQDLKYACVDEIVDCYSYEEAELACLKKLIGIVKNK